MPSVKPGTRLEGAAGEHGQADVVLPLRSSTTPAEATRAVPPALIVRPMSVPWADTIAVPRLLTDALAEATGGGDQPAAAADGDPARLAAGEEH